MLFVLHIFENAWNNGTGTAGRCGYDGAAIGILFTDGGRRRVITAQEAKQIRLNGGFLPPGAVLTPLAKEILEGLN